MDSSFRLAGNSGTLVTLVRPHLLLLAAITSIFAAEYLGRTWCFLFHALNHKFLPNKFWGGAGSSMSSDFIEKNYFEIVSLDQSASCHCVRQSAIESVHLPGICDQVIPMNTLRIWAIKIISSWKKIKTIKYLKNTVFFQLNYFSGRWLSMSLAYMTFLMRFLWVLFFYHFKFCQEFSVQGLRNLCNWNIIKRGERCPIAISMVSRSTKFYHKVNFSLIREIEVLLPNSAETSLSLYWYGIGK